VHILLAVWTYYYYYHHPLLIIRTYFQHFPNSPISAPPYRNYSAGDYTLLYSTLPACNWSDVYNSTSVDEAVACLSTTVHDAIEKSISYSHARKSKFPPWFSKALRYYIAKKNYYHLRFQRKQTSYHYDKFAFYRKLVKHSIKSDRLRWLETIDNNIEAQPQHFWSFVYNFRKQRSSPIQLLVDGVYLDEPSAVADAFANHFQSVYNTHCLVESPPPPLSLLNSYPLPLSLMRMFLKP
jgi:hypothetical protein